MNLDNFDTEILGATGKAEEILQRFYGKKIGRNNAEKQLAGIRTHLQYKQTAAGSKRIIGEMEETVIKADGTVTSKRLLLLSEEDSKNPRRLMELMGFDPLQWELVSSKVRRGHWDVSMKLNQGDDKDGKRRPQISIKETNHAFECTITVKPLQQILNVEALKEIFASIPAPKLSKYSKNPISNKLLELPIMDLHLGKLAWEGETRENWDLKIAEQTFKHVITEAIRRIELYNIKVEKILFPIGQDFFHFDSPRSTTTAGTIVDSDTRWQKMFAKGVELLIWAIENLRNIAPVESMYIAGNHDKMLSYCLIHTLNAYFRSCDDVAIDVSPSVRKYVRYGVNLIGLGHGSEEGKRIEVLMQVEAPQDWGETKYREWHLAHLHSEQVSESGGVIIRRVSSPTSIDSWHMEKGFIGAIKKVPVYIWDKETGKDLTIDINLLGEYNDVSS
jgi:hypothetical protein